MATDFGTTPWWERAIPVETAQRVSSEVGCSYRTLMTEKCRIEADKDGKPRRVCERKLHKFRDCGRGEELMEVMTEEVVDNDYRGSRDGNTDLTSSFKVPPPPREVLSSAVGEEVEQFMKNAEDLAHDLRRDHANGAAGGANLQWSTSSASSARYRKSGWFRSWFGPREAQCSPGRGRPNESLWEDYAQYFQDV